MALNVCGVFWVIQATVRSSEDQEVLLYRTDQSGRAWPVKGPSGPVEPHGGRRKKKAVRRAGLLCNWCCTFLFLMQQNFAAKSSET